MTKVDESKKAFLLNPELRSSLGPPEHPWRRTDVCWRWYPERVRCAPLPGGLSG